VFGPLYTLIVPSFFNVGRIKMCPASTAYYYRHLIPHHSFYSQLTNKSFLNPHIAELTICYKISFVKSTRSVERFTYMLRAAEVVKS
jgi:hypothetical protein